MGRFFGGLFGIFSGVVLAESAMAPALWGAFWTLLFVALIFGLAIIYVVWQILKIAFIVGAIISVISLLMYLIYKSGLKKSMYAAFPSAITALMLVRLVLYH